MFRTVISRSLYQRGGFSRITLLRQNGHPIEVDVSPNTTALKAALQAGINVGDHCEGLLACTSCLCKVSEKETPISTTLPAPSEKESQLLCDMNVDPNKFRLSCQLPASQLESYTVTFPDVNIPTSVPQHVKPMSFQSYTKSSISNLLEKYAANNHLLQNSSSFLETVATVFPFRTNSYVVSSLINWSTVPNDPIYQLTFPQPGMLPNTSQSNLLHDLVQSKSDPSRIRSVANEIRNSLNPHPAGQQTMNVPTHKGRPLPGTQHKYRESLLFFPAESQYCHSYCTYCFRWAQFVESSAEKFATNCTEPVRDYIAQDPSITDILFTGGDPMVMNSDRLWSYLHPFLSDSRLKHIRSIRIGTKSLAYWPFKYVTDRDSDSTIEVLRRVVASGRHLAVMAHFTHPAELKTPVVQEAIQRIRSTGAVIRCQNPVVRHINDDPGTLSTLWQSEVELGMIPYYLFVERDTGANHWFSLPLEKVFHLYTDALQAVSGLAKTVRGPSMSCDAGKVCILGIERIAGDKVFVLKMIQSRVPQWTERIFFAKFDEHATWMSDLVPAFGETEFFYEKEFDKLKLKKDQMDLL